MPFSELVKLDEKGPVRSLISPSFIVAPADWFAPLDPDVPDALLHAVIPVASSATAAVAIQARFVLMNMSSDKGCK
jgi:hypothetical protein